MSATAQVSAPDQMRRSAIAKVKIACKEQGLDDDTYRAMLERITGKRSAADCSLQQLGLVLEEFKARGWKPRLFVSLDHKQAPAKARAPGRTPAGSPMAKKARAMWISLHQLGVVRDPSEAALEAFGKRQLGVDRLQWADQSQGFRLIEALKVMAERAGWSQDVAGIKPAEVVTVLKLRLAAAMTKKLGAYPALVTAETVDYVIAKYAAEIREAML